MTTALPAGMTRYTGKNTMSAEDADGKLFYAFQKQENKGGLLVVENGIAREIVLSPQLMGHPSLECISHVGLWINGNQETDTRHVPQRIAVPEYVPFARDAVPPQVIEKGSPIDLLYTGTYTAADFDTPAETALRVGKQLAAIHQIVAILEAAGIVRRA